MAIAESQFDNWHGTGADKGSKETRERIENRLRESRSPVEQNVDCEFDVFLQGSYKNHTNVRESSDVDIVVKLESAWRSDLSDLDQVQETRYNNNTSSPDYGYTDFDDDVFGWLRNKYGRSSVERGNKAIKVEAEALPVDADVVTCLEYRVYHTYPPESSIQEPEYTSGIVFDTQFGQEIVNYPKLHYSNGGDKHRNYRETVRIFKNARDYYNDNFSAFKTLDAHSYGIECLLYNVPDTILKRSNRSARFIEVLEYLQSANLSEFQQVSEMEPLFGDSITQWNLSEAERLVAGLTELWEEW